MGFVARAVGRLRHGLVIQEVLDRLAALGIVIYPYVVYQESSAAPLPEPPLIPGLDCRHLTEADMSQVVLLSGEQSEAYWQERLGRGALVVGAFEDDALLACIWCDFDKLRTFGGGDRALRKLEPGEVAMSRAWTVPAWRGRGLMRCVRPWVNAALRERGCTRMWSVCMVFNKSVRRAKEKVGAPVSELRLALGLRGSFHRDLLVRRFPVTLELAQPTTPAGTR
jgi:GNAT superfamily N-acetyltransferase